MSKNTDDLINIIDKVDLNEIHEIIPLSYIIPQRNPKKLNSENIRKHNLI